MSCHRPGVRPVDQNIEKNESLQARGQGLFFRPVACMFSRLLKKSKSVSSAEAARGILSRASEFSKIAHQVQVGQTGLVTRNANQLPH